MACHVKVVWSPACLCLRSIWHANTGPRPIVMVVLPWLRAQATEPLLDKAADELDYVSRYKCGGLGTRS